MIAPSRLPVAPALVLAALAAASCGPGKGPPGTGGPPEAAAEEGTSAPEPAAPPPAARAPAVPAPPPQAPPPIPADTTVVATASGLKYSVLEKGSGTVSPRPGEKVRVHYTGWTLDGKVFDSSRERGAPAEFVVGQVIEGWNEALAMMRKGDRWKLTIPPDLGYGERGAGADIPPGATLIFDVALLEVFSIPEFVKPDSDRLVATGSGLRYMVLEEGEGTPPAADDAYDLEYACWSPAGVLVDATGRSGQTIQARRGDAALPFLDEAPFLMKPGATWILEVPAKLGFGERSPSPAIPAGSATIWRLTLRRSAPPLPVPEFRMPDPADLETTPSGLGVAVLEAGKGESPRMGQNVTVHYAGWLRDGTLFDASYPRAFPTTFRLGEVIRGWNEGLQRMRPGGEAILVIPPDLGYGARGAGPKIPPNATLVFRVRLLEVGD